MRGIIQRYSKEKKSGVIIANKNNSKYAFKRKDFKAIGDPKSGMRVEFAPNGIFATDVYKDISANLGRIYKQDSTNRFNPSKFGKNLEALFENGIHNKFGLIVSIAMTICLLLPLVDISAYIDPRRSLIVQLVNIWYGKIAFIALIGSCIFFYGGIKRHYLKILNGISSILIAIGYIEVYMESRSINIYAKNIILSPSMGFVFGVVTLVAFIYFTYIHEPYNTNEKTFS